MAFGVGGYTLRASHPELKVNVRGTTEVKLFTISVYLINCTVWSGCISIKVWEKIDYDARIWNVKITFLLNSLTLMSYITIFLCTFPRSICIYTIFLYLGRTGIWKWHGRWHLFHSWVWYPWVRCCTGNSFVRISMCGNFLVSLHCLCQVVQVSGLVLIGSRNENHGSLSTFTIALDDL